MNILAFTSKFPDEESCKAHFLNQRIAKGVICKKCGHLEQYWLKGKEQFQCKNCKFRTTLRSGTVLHSTKLSFQYWYIAIHLMTSTKKGFSAHELRRQLGHKRYEPIWNLMRKIRCFMGKSDDNKKLDGMVELDDAYISTHTLKTEKKTLKRGKGSQKKTKVTVMVESFPLENNKGDKSNYCGNFKMKVNKQETKESINYISQNNINQGSILFSDKASNFNDLENDFTHIQTLSSEINWNIDFKWVNTAIANVKRFLLGIYHVVKEKYLQLYLDEFCYNLNRRYSKDLFQNLILDLV